MIFTDISERTHIRIDLTHIELVFNIKLFFIKSYLIFLIFYMSILFWAGWCIIYAMLIRCIELDLQKMRKTSHESLELPLPEWFH